MSAQDIRLDFERQSRLGFDEAIFCSGKTVGHLATILDQARDRGASLLLTRISVEQVGALPDAHRSAIDYEPVSRTGFFGRVGRPDKAARIAVVTAGTSDVPTSREAVRTLHYYGESAFEVTDVGVAGLWRLLDRIEEIKKFSIVIVAAGMDAALPSVMGGLVPGLVIAVPTSVGYGVAQGGETALRAALASCAPGVVVVNIDNGYGAACAALRMVRAL
jgi:pyridinium-3,5-biscarboxylic acid mononucleotide synthase